MTSSPTAQRPLRVGIVGFGWMGQVHARAYTRLAQHYLDLPVRPQLVAVADNAADTRLAAAVAAFGFDDVHADWRELVARDDIDVVSVTGPNFIHRDVSRGGRAEREAPVGGEAGRPRRRRDSRDRGRRRGGGRPVRGRVQLPQRACRRARPRR